MKRVESAASEWRKAGRCDSNSCVEVARLDQQVAVRDSTLPVVSLRFDTASWCGLVGDLRNGRFHRS
jgi:hypothetical protein